MVDLWVVIFTLPAFTLFETIAPCITLNQYVDDLCLESDAEGTTQKHAETRCAAQLTFGCVVLVAMAGHHLEGEIALDKTAAIASTPAHLETMQTMAQATGLPHLGSMGGPHQPMG